VNGTPTPLAVAAVAGAYLVLFGVAEGLRAASVPAGATRALTHLGAGLLALSLPLVIASPAPVIWLSLGFLLLLAVTDRTGRLRAIHTDPDRRAGVYLYPVALAALYVLAAQRWPVYATAVLALCCGDTAAAVVGRRVGRHGFGVWGRRKTVEGSLAAFAVVAATTLAVWAPTATARGGGTGAWEIVLLALWTALVCALAEAASPWGTDNLIVPLAALAALGALGATAAAVVLPLAVAGLAGGLLLGPARSPRCPAPVESRVPGGPARGPAGRPADAR
jgi:phytol kinase